MGNITMADSLARVPVWAFVVLAVLIALGVRRLTERRVGRFVALLPTLAFGIWSLSSLPHLAAMAGWVATSAIWIGGVALGAASLRLLSEPPATALPDGNVLLPATVIPLILYLIVFAAKFGLAFGAAIDAKFAAAYIGAALAVSALMAGRAALFYARIARSV